MKVLVVVDMQKDFIDGSLGTKEAVAIVPNVIEKIKKYENSNDLICYTMDTHFENYLETQEGKKLPVKHCIKNTDGWQIPETILRNNKNYIFEKHTFGSIDLIKFLKIKNEINKFESIEFIGLCTDICVISNAMLAKANFLDTNVMVDEKCCAGVSIKTHKEALSVMKCCQIDII